MSIGFSTMSIFSRRAPLVLGDKGVLGTACSLTLLLRSGWGGSVFQPQPPCTCKSECAGDSDEVLGISKYS